MPRAEVLQSQVARREAPTQTSSLKKPGVEVHGLHMTVLKPGREVPLINLKPTKGPDGAGAPNKMTISSADLQVQSLKTKSLDAGGNPHTKGAPDDSGPTEACVDPYETSPGDPACSMPEVPCSKGPARVASTGSERAGAARIGTIDVQSLIPSRREGPVMWTVDQVPGCRLPKATPETACPPKPPGVK